MNKNQRLVLSALWLGLSVSLIGQQLPPNSDPSLVTLLEKHDKALETSFSVVIEATTQGGKTNIGRFSRGRVGSGWASRLEAATPSIVLRGKHLMEASIDRPDYQLNVFEITKTAIKARYSDPFMPRPLETAMQPPRLDFGNFVRRYRVDGAANFQATPPKVTVLVAKDSFFSALKQQSSKEHLKLFAYKVEINWFPDRYLIQSIRHINSDGDVFLQFAYKGYGFTELPEELFTSPEDYSLIEVGDKQAHVHAISKAKIEASKAELVSAGVSTNLIAKAREKRSPTNSTMGSSKWYSPLTFLGIFFGLIVLGAFTVFAIKRRSGKS